MRQFALIDIKSIDLNVWFFHKSLMSDAKSKTRFVHLILIETLLIIILNNYYFLLEFTWARLIDLMGTRALNGCTLNSLCDDENDNKRRVSAKSVILLNVHLIQINKKFIYNLLNLYFTQSQCWIHVWVWRSLEKPKYVALNTLEKDFFLFSSLFKISNSKRWSHTAMFALFRDGYLCGGWRAIELIDRSF